MTKIPLTETSPKGLLDCPPHILAQIAKDLDRPTATSLASTCSALRPSAESSIWQELNISVHRSFLPNPVPYNRTRPLGGNKLYSIRELYIWGNQEEHHAADGPHDQPLSLEKYFDDLMKHLQDDPIRLKAVRNVYLDVDRLLSMKFVELIKLIAPTMRHLEFIPPGFPYDPVTNRNVPTIRNLFDALGTASLDALAYLHLPLDRQWDETILSVLSKVPRLKTLRLSVEQPYSGSWGETRTFKAVSPPSAGWPVLPHLQAIEVDEMSVAFVPLLISLLENARQIRRVCLRDPAKTWNPSKQDDLMAALAECSTLKYLACRRNNLRGEYTEGFTNVEEACISEEKQPWGLPQLESVTIPPFPTMRCLYSYAQMNEARSITWAWDGEGRGLPPPIRPITPSTLISILAAPKLLLIQLPGSPEKERGIPTIDEEWDYWGSRACLVAHDRGVLVRTYESAITMDGGEGGRREVFVHCRSYSAHHSHIDEGIIHRSDNVWEEHVDYQGECPPGSVLAEVYCLLGESAGWKIPARGKVLPEEAWEVLRSWKASLAEHPLTSVT